MGLTAHPDPKFQAPPILPPKNGFLFLDRAKFPEFFSQDVPKDKAQFMAASQAPLGVQAFSDKITKAAWKTKPSYYIISTEDRMIPPDAERMMAKRAGSKVSEIKSSHVSFISHPKEIAAVIETAANSVK